MESNKESAFEDVHGLTDIIQIYLIFMKEPFMADIALLLSRSPVYLEIFEL